MRQSGGREQTNLSCKAAELETQRLASYQKGLEMSSICAVTMIMWLIFLALATFVGSTKGRPALGAVLALFLGFIGIIIALVPGRDSYYGAQWPRSR